MQELFDFNELDLHENRTGWLNAAQKAKWQQGLSRSQRFQHGGLAIFALVIGGILWFGVRYVNACFPEMSPETFSRLRIAGILVIAFSVLLALKGMVSTRRRSQDFEAILGQGEVKRLAGHIQLTRTFQWDSSDSYSSGYVYTLSMNGRELQVYGAGRLGQEEFGQALFDAFGLPLPPEQNTAETMRHVPQTVETHEAYIVYYLGDSWGQRHVCAIEKANG